MHDWDANQIPILVDANLGGETRKMVAMANRNAFFYLIDRTSGEFLLANPYSKQTWAKEIDETGRPVVLPDTEPTEEGNFLWPSLQGATNWFSPSYSPRTKMLYVAVREMSSYYFKAESEYEPGTSFLGGGERALQGDDAAAAIRALDISTGEVKWEFRQHSPPVGRRALDRGRPRFCGNGRGELLRSRCGEWGALVAFPNWRRRALEPHRLRD